MGILFYGQNEIQSEFEYLFNQKATKTCDAT